jgi:N-acetylmuramoyl-L-alanine amidase
MNQAILSFLFTLCFTAFSINSAALHVLIDPGHGGSDSGTINSDAKESDIALQVSLKLKKIIETNPSYTSTLSRTTDVRMGLLERTKLAEKEKADIFISIHVNSNQDPRVKGAEFYFQNQLPPDEESLFFASSENENQKVLNKNNTNSEVLNKKAEVLSIIQDLEHQTRMKKSFSLSRKLKEAWNKEPGAIRQAPLVVVTKINIPAVLIELGFLTNLKEASLLKNEAYQNELARKIFNGISKYQKERL